MHFPTGLQTIQRPSTATSPFQNAPNPIMENAIATAQQAMQSPPYEFPHKTMPTSDDFAVPNYGITRDTFQPPPYEFPHSNIPNVGGLGLIKRK